MEYRISIIGISLLIMMIILRMVVKSSRFKGFWGEKKVAWSNRQLDSSLYYSFHDVILSDGRGSTTQIDHIIVSPFAIFVIETKNMRGKIVGGEEDAQWIQKFPKKSYTFQNPLRQNYKHIKVLSRLLQVPDLYFKSIVIFVGHSTFEGSMPPNVVTGDTYIRYIKRFKRRLIKKEEVQQIIKEIERLRLAPGRKTRRQHIENIEQRYGCR